MEEVGIASVAAGKFLMFLVFGNYLDVLEDLRDKCKDHSIIRILVVLYKLL